MKEHVQLREGVHGRIEEANRERIIRGFARRRLERFLVRGSDDKSVSTTIQQQLGIEWSERHE